MMNKQVLQNQTQQNEYGFNYVTALAPDKLGKNFGAECYPYAGGCKQFNINSKVIDDYPRVVAPGASGWTRGGERIQTQLIGGAFKARGDGVLNNPDSLSNAWMPAGAYKQKCSRNLTEVTFDTWACMGAPLVYETSDQIPQETRSGLQYITKC